MLLASQMGVVPYVLGPAPVLNYIHVPPFLGGVGECYSPTESPTRQSAGLHNFCRRIPTDRGGDR